MRSAAIKLLTVISGVAAAAAFGVPATAHASPTPVSTPDCAVSQDIFLDNPASGVYGAVGGLIGWPSPPPLFNFHATSPQTLCQATVASNSSYVIYTNSIGYCLEYDTATNQVYQNNPAGCLTNAASAVTNWKSIYIKRNGLGDTEHEVQSTYNGEYVYAEGPAVLGPCGTAGQDLFVTHFLPLQIT